MEMGRKTLIAAEQKVNPDRYSCSPALVLLVRRNPLLLQMPPVKIALQPFLMPMGMAIRICMFVPADMNLKKKTLPCRIGFTSMTGTANFPKRSKPYLNLLNQAPA